MEPTPKPELAAAIDMLWERFLPQIRERVTVLALAAEACSKGKLTAAETSAAHDAAHKLAGSLGTFNLTRGTVLARELELLYSVEDLPASELGPNLAAVAAELRAMIENRK